MVSTIFCCAINYVHSLFSSTRHLIIMYTAISVGKLIPRSNSVLVRIEMPFFSLLEGWKAQIARWSRGVVLPTLPPTPSAPLLDSLWTVALCTGANVMSKTQYSPSSHGSCSLDEGDRQ